ncbi:MAG: hypothetical protein DMG57_15100 [Acidobacteria bacterium]|nr:MAG: hypothetical protein DMG57_15100 [Acidobacteriota bacterium]
MSAPLQISVGILALLLAGCEMRMGRAKTPATPQPAVAKIEHPAPEPESSEPLSIPQTQVELPQPQAIDPEALATPPVYTPAETAAQHPVHHPPKRQVAGQPNAPMTKPEQADPPPPEPAPAQVAEAPRPKIEPILPAEERRQMQEEIASRLREVDQLIGEITRRRSTESLRSSLSRIRSFANLSHEALERGETQQASALADRALLLAQETLRVR